MDFLNNLSLKILSTGGTGALYSTLQYFNIQGNVLKKEEKRQQFIIPAQHSSE